MYPTRERPAYGAFVWQQAEQLRRLGHIVDVVNILGFRSKLNYVTGAVEIARKTRDTTYDVVHAHYGFSAFPAWFRIRCPLVLTLHGSDVLGSTFEFSCTRLISRFVDKVILASEEMRKRIPGVVIPCGVDLNVFKPYDRSEARSRVGWPQDKRLIIFPFDPERRVKRYDLAVRAVEELNRTGFDVSLIPVFNVDNAQMPWYYSAADAMLLCSDHEGSPTSVKEALACNVPVVATDVGDLRNILASVSGTRICLQNVTDIAQGLKEVLTTSEKSAFAGRAASVAYDQTKTVQRLIEVYRAALASKS